MPTSPPSNPLLPMCAHTRAHESYAKLYSALLSSSKPWSARKKNWPGSVKGRASAVEVRDGTPGDRKAFEGADETLVGGGRTSSSDRGETSFSGERKRSALRERETSSPGERPEGANETLAGGGKTLSPAKALSSGESPVKALSSPGKTSSPAEALSSSSMGKTSFPSKALSSSTSGKTSSEEKTSPLNLPSREGEDGMATPTTRLADESISTDFVMSLNNEPAASSIFGLDCEMVLTRRVGDKVAMGDDEYTLARATLVKYNGCASFTTVFDEFVKVPQARTVVDRLEHVSGVAEENLAEATMDLSNVVDAFNEIIKEQDVVVGHSLWSDFQALKWIHPNFVDTSLFFKVQNAPKFTLGLKDCVEQLFGSELIFQTQGQAHNSVSDATFAVRVAMELAQRPNGPFVELPRVPTRFAKKLSFHGFDPTFPELHDILGQIQLLSGGKVNLPVKTSKRKSDNVMVGSVSIDFEDEEQTRRAFLAMPTNLKLCHPQGFPDQVGFYRKLVLFTSLTGQGFAGEVVSHHKADLALHSLDLVFNKKSAGRVFGRGGTTILEIQRLSGTQITNKPEGKDSVRFTVRGDKLDKVEKGMNFVRLAESDQLRKM